MTRRLPLRALIANKSGVALLEFAFILPILLLFFLTGAELANYITTRMRVSQLALKVADDAARMGSGDRLSAKKINEADINDLFLGANLQSGAMDMRANGRIILSSLQPVANPNSTSKFKIMWQRCFGMNPHPSTYGVQDATNLDGMGEAGRYATATDDNATMFVEVYYVYKPLISLSRAPSSDMKEIASMAIRDRRDLSDDRTLPNGTTNPNPTHPRGIYTVNGVTPATC